MVGKNRVEKYLQIIIKAKQNGNALHNFKNFGKRSKSIMSLILNIDTATEKASVCLAKNGKQLSLMHNERQQNHASWLHTAIEEMFQQEKYEMKDLNAVAVSAGP